MKKLTITLEYDGLGRNEYDNLADALRAMAEHIEDFETYSAEGVEGHLNYLIASPSSDAL